MKDAPKDASILVMLPQTLHGLSVARELNSTVNVAIKTAWLHEFLGRIDDDGYAIICKYVKENPDE